MMKNKVLLASLLLVLPFVFNGASVAEESKEVDDAHKGHNHEKIDKNSPEYLKYIKKKNEEQEKYIKDVEEFDKSDKFNSALLTQDLDFDINIGDPNAPVKIVEYASLSCGHCRHFHENVYYPLKKEYIDKGLVYFKYRHYPLNGAALKGAVVVSCVSDEGKQAMLGGLFRGQAQWAYAKNEAQLIDRLKTASLIAGLDEEGFFKCYEDKSTEEKILNNMKQSNQELKVDSTPTIFINGQRYLKGRDFDTIKIYIDSMISDAKKSSAEEK